MDARDGFAAILRDARKSALLRMRSDGIYLAIRSFDMFVPIVLKVVMISLADVSRKNLLGSGLPESLAQFCSSVEVGSLPVLTCTVYSVILAAMILLQVICCRA